MKALSESRNLNDDAPKPTKVKKPRPPFPLSRLAKKVWREVCAILESVNVLTNADLMAVARYSELRAEWIVLNQDRIENGYYIQMTSAKGVEYISKRPEIARLEIVEATLLKLERELGLTPASRGGMKAKPTKEKSTAFRKKLYRMK